MPNPTKRIKTTHDKNTPAPKSNDDEQTTHADKKGNINPNVTPHNNTSKANLMIRMLRSEEAFSGAQLVLHYAHVHNFRPKKVMECIASMCVKENIPTMIGN